jgi:hypothetical protein
MAVSNLLGIDIFKENYTSKENPERFASSFLFLL